MYVGVKDRFTQIPCVSFYSLTMCGGFQRKKNTKCIFLNEIDLINPGDFDINKF